MRRNAIPELTPEQVERFWNKIEVPEQPSCCWEWTKGLSEEGYGSYWVGKHGNTPAHLIAYTLLIGPVPEGLVPDHLCRNRRCVNPDHIEFVTNAENVRRGYGVTAMNARKTHCPQGHEYTPENTLIRVSRPNERECLTCKRNRHRRQLAVTEVAA